MERTFRVVAPLAIHEESVIMFARRELQNGSPDTVRAFLQIDGLLIPMREVSGQLYAGRVRCAEGEGLVSIGTVAARCLFLHVGFWL